MPDSPLIEFARRGLARCWMPAEGCWSHKYHLDGRADPNESLPHSDVYYSLNCLLGLARSGGAAPGEGMALADVFASLCARMPGLPMRHYAHGMALWTAAELGLDAPGHAMDQARRAAADTGALGGWTAQEIGLVLSGLAHQARHDRRLEPAVRAMRDLVMQGLRGPHDLYFDRPTGFRRNYATFATQVYAGLGLFHAAELLDDEEALQAARRLCAALIERQGPRGEWAWFYHAPSGRIVDWYEVYSVHQHGMAPALLHHAVASGVAGAREALVKGFGWIFGENEMSVTMLRPSLGMIVRSQRRAGWGGDRRVRAARGVLAGLLGLEGKLLGQGLELTEEMRSYELGWILWSFGGRADYPELTDRADFM